MFKLVVCLALVVVCSAQLPLPYAGRGAWNGGAWNGGAWNGGLAHGGLGLAHGGLGLAHGGLAHPAVVNGGGLAHGLGLERPEPYSFGYQTTDEFGTHMTRQEESDGNGNVRGSYSYREANGIGRTVEYHADPVSGFSANVITNEPGTVDSAPAAVQYRSSNRHY